MRGTHHLKLVAIVIFVIGAAIVLAFLLAPGQKTAPVIAEAEPVTLSTPEHSIPKDKVATLWQTSLTNEASDKRIARSPATKTSAEGVNEARVLAALGDLTVDEAGNLVVDHIGLEKLYENFGYGAFGFDQHQLAAVQSIILDNLPEPVASQTAQIVAGFQQFLEGKRALDQLYSSSDNAHQLAIRLHELDSLRELSFGRDTADLLFGKQRAHESYMLDSLRLRESQNLTEVEREQHEQALRERITFAPAIQDWPLRYKAYQEQKLNVVNSSLPAGEKQRQIDLLFAQHFSREEAEKIDALRLTEF